MKTNKYVNDINETLHLIGVGLFAFAFGLIVLSLIPPGDNPWAIFHILRPAHFYIVTGATLCLGLLGMIIEIGKEEKAKTETGS